MGFFAGFYDSVLWLGERSGMQERRRRLLERAQGRTLEIGAGTGLNLPFYPEHVDDLVVLEPQRKMAVGLEHRADRLGRTPEVVIAPAEDLPFPDDSFDTVVSTLVLCTVDDLERAVQEVGRVLRPGGQFLFLEHVRAASPRLQRWQDRLHGPWRLFADGCHCNRDTMAVLESTMDVGPVETGRWHRMPPIVHPLVAGSAAAA
jgi:ubiquinone/menaquinone biosynthesis C-methylase UbiE